MVSLSSIWLCPGQDELQSDAQTQVPASREDGRPGVFRVKDKERNRWEGCHRVWSERPRDITTQSAQTLVRVYQKAYKTQLGDNWENLKYSLLLIFLGVIMELVMEENGLIFRRCMPNYSGITVSASVNYFHMVHSSHIYMDTHTYIHIHLIYVIYILLHRWLGFHCTTLSTLMYV